MKKSRGGNVPNILLIEDDELFRQAMKDYLQHTYTVGCAESAEAAWGIIQRQLPDVILLDITLPGASGMDVLKKIRQQWPDLPVIMITAIDKIQTVVESIKLGAFDYLAKPVIVEELLSTIERALDAARIRRGLEQRQRLQLEENREYRLIGESDALERIRREIQVVSRSDSPVLIVGETGTGKELVARQIHAASHRAAEPFVAINCGAIPRDLVETEFFGYRRGAFTGATSSEIGKFQLADRGTLLLDEIGELPVEAQTRFLRVLDENEFYPVGSTQLIRVDVRILASTNRTLEDLVQQKLFREDLYFRLNVYTIHIPPLRERPEDIVPIAEFYMEQFNRRFAKNFRSISEEAQQMVRLHPWKGNVRELRNLLERVILSEEGETLESRHLTGVPFRGATTEKRLLDLPAEGISLEEVEKNLLIQALQLAHGNKTRAAKLLKMSPPTFYYRLEKYGIE